MKQPHVRNYPAGSGSQALAFVHRAVLALALTIAAGGAAMAIDPSERLKDPELESRARALSAELRCLVCQNQSIDDSDAPLAKDLRRLVRERLQTGETDAEVKSFIVDRYGDFVLLKPPFGWHTLLLWMTPVLVLGAIGFGIARNLRNAGAVAAAGPANVLSADEERRLKAILGESGREHPSRPDASGS